MFSSWRRSVAHLSFMIRALNCTRSPEPSRNAKPNPFAEFHASSTRQSHRMSTKKSWKQVPVKEGSPDDASRYCSSKVIVSPGCKQSPRSWGGKN